MKYVALFAIILASLANSLAHFRNGRVRSRSVIGHTSEICEPVYDRRYREYEDDDDFGNNRHRIRDKQRDRSYNYDNDLSDESLRELLLEKALLTKKTGRPRTRHRKVNIDIDEIKSLTEINRDAKRNEKISARTVDHNMNTNVNRLGNRVSKNVVEDLIKEVDKNDSAVDDSDVDPSVEPASRILENNKNQDNFNDDEEPKVKVKKYSTTRKHQMPYYKARWPDSKFNPPPFFPSDHDVLGYRIEGNKKSSVNIDNDTDDIVIESELKSNDEKNLSPENKENRSSNPADPDTSEKNSSVQPADVEIIPGNQDLETIDNLSSTQEVKISSTSEPIELVTTDIKSVTETSELSGTSVNADDKRTKTKHRHKHGKSHGKKKKKTHRKHHNQQPQITEQEKIRSQQQNEFLAENNIESTTNIIETIQESSQSSVSDSSPVEEIAIEKKLDLNESILKLLIAEIEDGSSPEKVQKLKQLLDQLNVDEKETILRELEEKVEKRTKKTKKTSKTRIDQEIREGDESKVISEPLLKSSNDDVTPSDDETSNVEVKNVSESPDETENKSITKSESESETELQKEPQEIPEKLPKVTINDEPAVNDTGLNNEEIDENESSDRVKAVKISSLLSDSKLKVASEESLAKQVDQKDSVEENQNENSNATVKLNPSLPDQTERTNDSQEPQTLHSERINDDKEDNDDKEKEEKSLMPPDEEGEVKTRRRNHGGARNNRGSSNTNKNSNVNTNVNKMIPELRQLKSNAEARRLQRVRDRTFEKNGRNGSRRKPKLNREDGNINVNKNTNVNSIGSKNPEETEKGFENNRRSIRVSPRQINRNKNTNINSNFNDIEHSHDEDDEHTHRRSLARSNKNTNVNTNSNVNRNVVNEGVDRPSRHHGDHEKKVKLSKKTVDSILDEVNDLRQQLAEKEHDPDGDKKRDYRRRLLHKRHNDLAYE